MGERYKVFPKESKAMLRGEYGKLPGEVNEEVRAKAGIAPEDVITCRPADLLEPELEKYKEEFKDIAKSEEDVLSWPCSPRWQPKFIRPTAISLPPRCSRRNPHRTPTPSGSCTWSISFKSHFLSISHLSPPKRPGADLIFKSALGFYK